ncbi:MAG: insulinase family protein [Bacteriovoracaceae bacterium]|nr:insulinase family protein [Bacteriovoracaceae bacterium]
MKKLSYILITLFVCLNAFGDSSIKNRIKKFEWDGIEVVWLEDNRYPTYDVMVYFGDGALSDAPRAQGETSAMFGMMASGTRRFSQKDISENLEFFGATHGPYVTHEYSIYSINGLVKDIVPTMKMVCHLFKDAAFPKQELSKEKRRMKNSLQNIVNDQGSLASRVFREVSLSGSPYYYPVGGKLKDIKGLNQKGLSKKLDYFNTKVKKRIYISGPESTLVIKRILNEDCGWSGKDAQYVRSIDYSPIKTENGPDVLLVTVPKSNQAQVRIGRFLNKGEFDKNHIMSLTSGFLGGGFTSKLMREVRGKGLTYSIGAFAAGQRDYGRAGISTSTANEKLIALLSEIEKTITGAAGGDISNEDLERARGLLIGSHPFQFEKSSDFLQQLIFLDHEGKNYEDLFDFTERVSKVNKKQVVDELKKLFGWNKQTILILGNKVLLKKLKASGKNVKILNYKKFL